MGLLKNFIKYLVINIIISAILAAVISAAAIYFIPASANRPQQQEKQELIRSKVLLIQEQTELRSAIKQAERGGLLPDWYYQQQLTLLRSKLGVISGQITATQAAIKSLEMLPDQGWQKRFRQVILNNFYYALAVVFLLPVLWKIFLYYIIGYLVEKIPPVRNTSAAREPISAINSFHADVAVDYTIRDGERLFLRSGDWGKKRTNLKARTKLLWQKNIR